MWDKLIRSICELTQKMDAVLDEISSGGGPTTGTGPFPAGNRIGVGTSPVQREGDEAVRVLNDNPNRLGVIIHNYSDGELWIALNGERCNADHYTFKLKGGETLHMDERQFKEVYKGAMSCKWDPQTGPQADSMAMVTELFWTN